MIKDAPSAEILVRYLLCSRIIWLYRDSNGAALPTNLHKTQALQLTSQAMYGRSHIILVKKDLTNLLTTAEIIRVQSAT